MITDYVPNRTRMHNKWFGYARMCPQLLEILGIETLYERLCTGTLSGKRMTFQNRLVSDLKGESIPSPPRLGEPDEFASLVMHMLDNVMLNGTVVRLDGAIRMAPR